MYRHLIHFTRTWICATDLLLENCVFKESFCCSNLKQVGYKDLDLVWKVR